MNSVISFIKEDLLNLPYLASEHGDQIDNFIVYVHLLMAALFVGWLAYFLYTLYRFSGTRQKKADFVGARTHASSYIEFLVAAIEGVLLIGFSIPLWAKTVEEFPTDQGKGNQEVTEIYLMAQQFGWNFRYPGPDGEFAPQKRDLVSQTNTFGIVDQANQDDFTPQQPNTIVVPVDKPVLLHISSQDVVHSFAVHAMRVCQDAIPGMSVPMKFTPTKVGKYQIVCAQLCGVGHSQMKGVLDVRSQEDYAKWVAEQSGQATSGSGSSSAPGAASTGGEEGSDASDSSSELSPDRFQ